MNPFPNSRPGLTIPAPPTPEPTPPFSWRDTLLSIWESENALSIRLIIATGITAFALIMRGRGAQYMTTDEALKYLEVVRDLLLIGAAKVALSRFSPKPNVDPTEQPKPDVAASTQT